MANASSEQVRKGEKKNPPLFLPPAHLSSPSQSSINEKAGHVWLKAAYNKLCTEHLSRGVRAHMYVLIFSNSFLTSLYLPNLTAVLYSYLLSNHFLLFLTHLSPTLFFQSFPFSFPLYVHVFLLPSSSLAGAGEAS